MTKKSCQYKAPNCQKTATFQHILKLGKVKISKQWVCAYCKEYLQNKEANK